MKYRGVSAEQKFKLDEAKYIDITHSEKHERLMQIQTSWQMYKRSYQKEARDSETHWFKVRTRALELITKVTSTDRKKRGGKPSVVEYFTLN